MRAYKEDVLHFCILPLEQLTQFVFLCVKVNESLYSCLCSVLS